MTDKVVVLVVDDEFLILDMIEDGLSDAGFEVLRAEEGAVAIEQLAKVGNNIAGLITDIRMPGMSGWEVARRARELFPNLPVIYTTGDSAPDWTSQGVPMSILINKPFASAQIVTAMAQLLNDAASGT